MTLDPRLAKAKVEKFAKAQKEIRNNVLTRFFLFCRKESPFISCEKCPLLDVCQLIRMIAIGTPKQIAEFLGIDKEVH